MIYDRKRWLCVVGRARARVRPEQPIMQPFAAFDCCICRQTPFIDSFSFNHHFLQFSLLSPFIFIWVWQYFRYQNSRTLLSAQYVSILLFAAGRGPAPAPAPRGGDSRTKPAIAVQAVMWAMFDKAKPYTHHIWYYIHTGKLLMQKIPFALLLIRLYQVFSNLLVLMWRDEALSNIDDRSGSRIVIQFNQEKTSSGSANSGNLPIPWIHKGTFLLLMNPTHLEYLML